MTQDLKQAFESVKPLCDAIMVNPSLGTIAPLHDELNNINKETIQEMQLYILFPIISHLKSKEIKPKHEVQRHLVDAMKAVMERSTVGSTEVFSKCHNCLLSLVLDKSQPGMVAKGPEELKLSVMECLATIILNMNDNIRVKLFQNQVASLAQTIFVAIHIAKLEKLRALRLSALNCVGVYTGTHQQLTTDYRVNHQLEKAAVDMVGGILPGVLAALHDVATSCDNPGHAVIVSAVSTIHKLVCLVMNDKYLSSKADKTTEDFARILQDKAKIKDDKEVSNEDKSTKKLRRMSPEWFAMAGEKLKLITTSLMALQTHEHVKVRTELAVFCARVLLECPRTMAPSTPVVLDILISLSNDKYIELSQYCSQKLDDYFNSIPHEAKSKAMDGLADNFMSTLLALPRILNNIDCGRKMASLSLLYGHVRALERAGRLPLVLGLPLCRALLHAATMRKHLSLLATTVYRGVDSDPPDRPSWCKLKHIEERECEDLLIDVCRLLGNSECSSLIIDQLLDLFHDSAEDRAEIIYILNHIASAPRSNTCDARRVLSAYVEGEMWYLPLEVARAPAPACTPARDVIVHDPSAWEEERVPGLYEGAVETRYTDISYEAPRANASRDPAFCATLAEAQTNVLVCAALTHGVGLMAERLGDQFQPFLLKTLCLVLERVGSRYEVLHEAGAAALRATARAGGHPHVGDLILCNADYFTYQVTTRLKKSWDRKAALEILTVVMEYSDVTIFDCLYGIVSDVLIQSCDNYHEQDLSAYLQVFLTFVMCIQKWFPDVTNSSTKENKLEIEKSNVFRDVIEYARIIEETESMLSKEESDGESRNNAEEMYREDLKQNEENILDYDDTVSAEKPPLPQHITLTVTILKRCLNFVPSQRRSEKLLAMHILDEGLKILRHSQDELLPIVHLIWSPLVVRFQEINEPIVLRRALELLVTMAEVSKDFISNRTIKEVLPNLYKFLEKWSQDSHLKDAGSAYRQSQAYKLQVAALTALPTLAADLHLEDAHLERAMDCAHVYLSNKQPKALQDLAVNFFSTMFRHDYGAVWHHFNIRHETEIEEGTYSTNIKLILCEHTNISLTLLQSEK